MAKRSKTGTEATGTKAQSHEGTEPEGTEPDASPVTLPWEADVDAPMEGAVRAEMLARVAGTLPEQDQAGYVAFLDAALGDDEPVSFGQASEFLGEYMAARLADLHGQVGELSEKLEAAAADAAAERAKEPNGQSAKEEGADSGTRSLSDVLVAAVRQKCAAALALPVVTGTDQDANPYAGLERLSDAQLRNEANAPDPFQVLDPIKSDVCAVQDELVLAVTKANAIAQEAFQRFRDAHAHASRFTLARREHAGRLLAEREAKAAAKATQ